MIAQVSVQLTYVRAAVGASSKAVAHRNPIEITRGIVAEYNVIGVNALAQLGHNVHASLSGESHADAEAVHAEVAAGLQSSFPSLGRLRVIAVQPELAAIVIGPPLADDVAALA